MRLEVHTTAGASVLEENEMVCLDLPAISGVFPNVGRKMAFERSPNPSGLKINRIAVKLKTLSRRCEKKPRTWQLPARMPARRCGSPSPLMPRPEKVERSLWKGGDKQIVIAQLASKIGAM